MHNLFNLNPKISTALAVLVGYALLDDLDTYEQNVLGNWLMLVSQLIITNAASQQLVERNMTTEESNIFNINSKEIKSKYNPLFYEKENIKKYFNDMNSNDREKIFNELQKRISNIEKMLNDLHKNSNF